MDTYFKKKKKRKRKKWTGVSEKEREREREEKSREINFSFISMKIGSWVFVRVKGKVDPRIASYAWVPKSWNFVKLHEVEREEKSREINFSLRSMEIGSWVFIGAKSKVDPRIASYTWVPKSWNFVKLHKVGNFLTWVISNLKVI